MKRKSSLCVRKCRSRSGYAVANVRLGIVSKRDSLFALRLIGGKVCVMLQVFSCRDCPHHPTRRFCTFFIPPTLKKELEKSQVSFLRKTRINTRSIEKFASLHFDDPRKLSETDKRNFTT